MDKNFVEKWDYALNLMICLKYGDPPDLDEGEEIDICDIPYLYDPELETRHSLPFSYKDFCKQEDIMATLDAYGLEHEHFWYVVCIIYLLTKSNCKYSFAHVDSFYEALNKLSETLDGAKAFTLSVEGKKPVHVTGGSIASALKEYVDVLVKQTSGSHSAEFLLADAKTEAMSVWTWYAARLFKILYKVLRLPDKRARNRKETRRHNGIVDTVEVIMDFSYSKTLLTSRLVYFMGLTDNPAFLYDDNSLKSLLKEYSKRHFSVMF